MATFSTNFAPPAPITGLAAFANVDASSVDLTWDATALGAGFRSYRIYRSPDGIAYSEVGIVLIEADSAFSDYEAPLDVPLWYQVTVWNADEESAPVDVTSELDVSAWWFVTPGDGSNTFELRTVVGYSDGAPLQQEDYEPLGRSRKLVVTGELLGNEGSLTVNLSREDAATVDRLRQRSIDDTNAFHLLKSPFGEVFRIRLRSIGRSRGGAGRQVVTLPFVEVE